MFIGPVPNPHPLAQLVANTIILFNATLNHRIITISSMATATLTPSHGRFGTSFSGSIARPDLHAAEPVSMADQLPSINFGFDDLRERMAQFTARFDDFIERGRKRVLEERNHFRLNVAEIQGASGVALWSRLRADT